MTPPFGDSLSAEGEAVWRDLLARAHHRGAAARAPLGSPEAEVLESLYGPLVERTNVVVGQMGQSLDGCIATRTGHSHFVTGPESLVHLHRLRALVDAVVVGKGTVAADDPQLTVRRVQGPDPVRVVVDLRRELDPDRRAWSDASRALRVVLEGAPRASDSVPELEVRGANGRLDPTELVRALAARGHRRLLIEGGGRLVSAFLRAGALDRLHVVVAPLLIGGGRPGVAPTPVDDLGDALRPASRVYPVGGDALFDLDLSARTPSTST